MHLTALTARGLLTPRVACRGASARASLISTRLATTHSIPRLVHTTSISREAQTDAPGVSLQSTLNYPDSTPAVGTTSGTPPSVKGTIWFDNIFPVRYWKYDPRWLWVRKYASDAAKAANKRLIPHTFPANFKYLGATPNWKEGGVFVHFKYEGHSVDEAVETIRNHIEKRGIRSWMNLQLVRVFHVKGRPWVDDMIGRLPSEVLKVEFNGPDASVEDLYKEFRPYGKIVNITLQPANVKDLPRFALIEYMRVRSATSARNCLNGEAIVGTTININYEKRKHTSESIWNWISSHPRITVPVLLGLLAGLTYVVFDPIRVFFITNQLTDRFSLRKYTGAAEQLWSSTTSSISFMWGHKHRDTVVAPETWTERQQDLARLQHHLKQTPDTVVLVHGPKGSGKSQLVKKAIEHSKYKLVIRCQELAGQPTHVLLNRLAAQINFKPMFNWLVQMSAMIDTMITATTGAKAGLSTTNEGQIHKMLELLSAAVSRVTMQQKEARNKILSEQRLHQRMENNGESASSAKATADEKNIVESSIPDVEYPVIVIDGFLASEASKDSVIYDLLVEWAAVAAEYHLAHVILISDNPIAVKTISKALPNKTIEMVSLSDATPESALAVVQRRLGDSINTDALKRCIDGLGGRLTDLELLIQKIRAGMSPEDAYQEIVVRAINEVRKLGLGEDAIAHPSPTTPVVSTLGGGNKNTWTPIQFWKIVQLLTKHDEISYDGTRFHAFFKGDESPLQAMERAGLISITYDAGRPYALRASRPVYRTAFMHMLADRRLAATMGILTTKQGIADEEDAFRKTVGEMKTLIDLHDHKTVKRVVSDRLAALRDAFKAHVDKIAQLNNEQKAHKAVVAIDE
ncbi:RNA12 protein-domain-containing protein [Powellomyces hirtus]|nr:RNA12 protein-domain-containing protein [Powellomyces hirtus]